MKSKKLLSILCLLALTGCNGTTTSSPVTESSTHHHESTSPDISSTTLSEEISSSTTSSDTSSEASSSTSEDSSDTSSDLSSESSNPTIEVTLESLRDRIENSITKELTEVTRVETTSLNITTKSTKFYNNATLYSNYKTNSAGTIINNNTTYYSTIKDGRYYHVIDNKKNNTTSVEGYEISDTETGIDKITLENANKKMKSIFGIDTKTNNLTINDGTDLSNIVLQPLNYYDRNSNTDTTSIEILNLSGTVENGITTIELSYLYLLESVTSKAANVFSSEYIFNADNELTSYTLKDENYKNSYDFENYEIPADAIPITSTYSHTFSYSEELSNESATTYDLSTLTYTDFTVEAYFDKAFTEKVEGTVPLGKDIYFKVTGTPETATSDYILLSSSSESILKTNNLQMRATAKTLGDATLSFISANGIKKEISYTVALSSATAIEFELGANMPTTLEVGSTATLPGCLILPHEASQDYAWRITEGEEFATIELNTEGSWSIKATQVGTVKLYAYSTSNETIKTQEYSIEITSAESSVLDALYQGVSLSGFDSVYYLELNITLTLSPDGTGIINFGKELHWQTHEPAENDTIYTFKWTCDDNTITISEGQYTYGFEFVDDSDIFAYYSGETPEIIISSNGEISVKIGGALCTASTSHEHTYRIKDINTIEPGLFEGTLYCSECDLEPVYCNFSCESTGEQHTYMIFTAAGSQINFSEDHDLTTGKCICGASEQTEPTCDHKNHTIIDEVLTCLDCGSSFSGYLGISDNFDGETHSIYVYDIATDTNFNIDNIPHSFENGECSICGAIEKTTPTCSHDSYEISDVVKTGPWTTTAKITCNDCGETYSGNLFIDDNGNGTHYIELYDSAKDVQIQGDASHSFDAEGNCACGATK